VNSVSTLIVEPVAEPVSVVGTGDFGLSSDGFGGAVSYFNVM